MIDVTLCEGKEFGKILELHKYCNIEYNFKNEPLLVKRKNNREIFGFNLSTYRLIYDPDERSVLTRKVNKIFYIYET